MSVFCLPEHERFLLAENRIYYGMFYMVMALALKHGFMTSKHAQLLGWFNKEFVRAGQVDVALGKVYQAGFEKRQESDYQDFVTFSVEEVEHDLSLMIRFLDAVEALITQEHDTLQSVHPPAPLNSPEEL